MKRANFKTFKHWLITVYFKMQRKRRDGGGPGPEPGAWTPIQQVSGWSITNQGGAGIDNGTSFGKDNHSIVGLDESLYLLNFKVSAATMPPAGFPMRVTVNKWTDRVNEPGELPEIVPSSIQIPGSGNPTKPNAPSVGFPGSPFEFTCTPNNSGDGQEAYSQVGIAFDPPQLVGAGNPTISIRFKFEIQGEDGIWRSVAEAPPGNSIDDYGNTSYDGATKTFYSYAPQPLNVTIFGIRYNVTGVQRLTMPCRVTVVEYVITPDPEVSEPVIVNQQAKLIFSNGSSGSATLFDSSGDYPNLQFNSEPYQVEQPTTNVPNIPPTSYNFDVVAFECAFNNSATIGQQVDFDIAIEVQLPQNDL